MLADWIAARRGYLSGWKWRSARRRGIRVFRYHGIVERKRDPVLDRNQLPLSVFRAQMDYLRRFRVMGLAELAAELEAPARSGPPAALITFDDGFHNNVLAAEVLAQRRLPWSLYVPSGEVGPRRAMWSVEVSLLVMRGRADEVEALGRRWSLRDRPSREKSFREMRARLKAIPAAERREAVAALHAQFPAGESQRLLEEEPHLRMLDWAELGELSRAGVEIGSHGVFHEIHNARQTEDVRRRELGESRAELERRLGKPCVAFAYPNGNFVEASAQEAADAGYGLAFTTQTGTLEAKTAADRFLLPRLSASGSLHGFVRTFWWEEYAAVRPASAPAPRPSEA